MIIQDTEEAEKYTREQLGGKGLNLLRLAKFSRQNGLFRVPPFFIYPVDAMNKGGMVFGQTGYYGFNNKETIESAFSNLTKPIIVRSSQPQEDGQNASFAGMFCSIPDVKTFKEFGEAAFRVKNSVYNSGVEQYIKQMNIDFNYDMALITQEQVTDSLLTGTIQIENDGVTLESIERGQKERDNVQIDHLFLKDYAIREMAPLEHIGEGHYYMLMNLAKDAKNALGLEGIVQVEFCLNPQRKPDFVQIRKLPDIKNLEKELNMNIPENTPKIESRICNGIAGELILPAYVTVSPFGIQTILISNGYRSFMGRSDDEERTREFELGTKLANNQDFFEIKDLKTMQGFASNEAFRGYDMVWTKGNKLFKDYILVCDQLNESCVGMADLTTNKRAIITCGEESKTSHAMIVARDLGIMCMGVRENDSDLDRFFYQVESGDYIHMKSDGKRAIAYIERRRDKDPYEIQE